MSGSFQLSVVTPEGAVLETEAVSVVFPAFDGEYGVLHDHAPLVTLLGIGELRVIRPDASEEHYYVDGGFAQFADNKLSLLTEQAQPLSEEDKLTVARARRIERFLSQAFYVAEQFTGFPGVYVSREDTVRSFEELVDGKWDHLPEQAFMYVGTIEDAAKRAEEMEKEG